MRSIDADYGDIIYFSEGRWLSWDKMLRGCDDLRNEIKSCMESKRNIGFKGEDEKWLS